MLAIGIAAVFSMGPVLGIEDNHFTIDTKPTFLLGISYYGALAIEDERVVKDDLATMRAHGFNWIRVWATWNGFENNVSATTAEGEPREPYLARLLRLCQLAGEHGIMVDVTLTRGDGPDYPSTQAEHMGMIRTLAKALVPYRNVYIDVANERNVGDARYVSSMEVAELIAAIKAIDPNRICTASHGGEMSDEEITKYITVGHVDILTPHRPRDADSPNHTTGETQRYLNIAKQSRALPIHYQEPFRRGYDSWQPNAKDFQTDLEAAMASGAAGWCFHNGSVRSGNPDETGRPRRSFDLRPGEGRLFTQFDPEEQAFLKSLKASELATPIVP